MKRIIVAVIISLQMVLLVACAAGESGKTKSYTWDNVSFTVKSITEAQADDGAGKRIAVTIDLGDSEMNQGVFESNVSSGKFKLDGVKPEEQYLYHMGKMVFGANGFVPTITGEIVVYFNMDAGYELNENDLVITE